MNTDLIKDYRAELEAFVEDKLSEDEQDEVLRLFDAALLALMRESMHSALDDLRDLAYGADDPEEEPDAMSLS